MRPSLPGGFSAARTTSSAVLDVADDLTESARFGAPGDIASTFAPDVESDHWMGRACGAGRSARTGRMVLSSDPPDLGISRSSQLGRFRQKISANKKWQTARCESQRRQRPVNLPCPVRVARLLDSRGVTPLPDRACGSLLPRRDEVPWRAPDHGSADLRIHRSIWSWVQA